MAICELCEQARERVYSCMKRMDGQIPFDEETHLFVASRGCLDCGVGTGGFHHPGCSIERCPNCQGKLMDCICEVAQNYHSLTARGWWTRLPRRAGESIVSGH
jgi:hypothetical protein